MTNTIRSKLANWFSYGALLVFAFAAIFPVLWALVSSFKSSLDITAMPPKIIFSPTLEHYNYVFSQGIAEPLINSAIVVAGTVILVFVAGCPAAYGLARFKTKLTKGISGFVFGMRFLPTVAFALPLFLVFSEIGLTGTRIGLILSYQMFALPTVLFMMWSFFVNIPPEVEEAAKIDGCGHLGVFFKIALPMVAPGIAAALIICAIFAWNHFFLALILGGNVEVATMTLNSFTGGEDIAMQWGPLYAYSVMITAPIIVLGYSASNYLIKGLSGDTEL